MLKSTPPRITRAIEWGEGGKRGDRR